MRPVQSLLFVLLILISFVSQSHAETPEFFSSDLLKSQDLATKYGKIMYIHIFAEWSPACVHMREHVFNSDQVQDFYQSNFVCVEADVEAANGQKIIRQYEITDFPTHLFVDKDGKELHRAIGLFDDSTFVELGTTALSPKERLMGFKKRFENGDRKQDFVFNYFGELLKAGLPTAEKFDLYWSGLKERHRMASFPIMEAHLKSTKSDAFVHLFNNRAQYSAEFGKERVYMTLDELIEKDLMEALYTGTPEEFMEKKQFVLNSGYEFANRLLTKADLEAIANNGNWIQYAVVCERYIAIYNVRDAAFLNTAAWIIYENTKDRPTLKKATRFAEAAAQNSNSYYCYETWACLLYKQEAYEKAQEIIKKALVLAKEQNIKASKLHELNNRMLAAK